MKGNFITSKEAKEIMEAETGIKITRVSFSAWCRVWKKENPQEVLQPAGHGGRYFINIDFLRRKFDGKTTEKANNSN